jgi:enamine deaminase RidA (YjgF/YER057c/UK114 family)
VSIYLGGWDPTTGALPPDTPATPQIEQAFKNVDIALRHAGASKGWTQVYRVNSYHTQLDDGVLAKMKAEFEKWLGPSHRPIWTCVEVPKLGLEGMKVEIEVVAHVPEA